jgi:hypothetical protein
MKDTLARMEDRSASPYVDLPDDVLMSASQKAKSKKKGQFRSITLYSMPLNLAIRLEWEWEKGEPQKLSCASSADYP